MCGLIIATMSCSVYKYLPVYMSPSCFPLAFPNNVNDGTGKVQKYYDSYIYVTGLSSHIIFLHFSCTFPVKLLSYLYVAIATVINIISYVVMI